MRPGLSRRDYDCISSVFSLSSGGWPARVKDIATKMKVSSPTAVEFLEKLSGMSLVEKGPSGYRLTSKGTTCFNEATRTHRLLETLLVRNGLALEKACMVSSSVWSPIAEADLEKICASMQHPDRCPHGRRIPIGGSHV